jgi:RNA polymerase sigma-70 factor (ECF subfamily)
MPAPDATADPGGRAFHTTRWSVITAAQGDTTSAAAAVGDLCQCYWFPLYAFVRRRGHAVHDAQDLTQAFFARFLEHRGFAAVDRANGRFRSFLLASLKHFLANEYDRQQAAKRGGGCTFVPLNDPNAEARYHAHAAEQLTAERLFDREWALALLDRALARLAAEMAAEGKGTQFEALKFCLTGAASAPYAEVAASLGLSEGAVKVAVHRLRTRYRAHLRAEVAATVEADADIDDELRELLRALSV